MKIKNIFRRKKNKDSGAFEFAQRLGKSFMLPISILPIAGLLLGIGSAFTNIGTVYFDQTFHLNGPFSTGGTILNFMKSSGDFLFKNIPLLFSISIPLGLSKKNKGIAALAGLIAFVTMHSAISGVLALQGKNSITTGVDYLMVHGETFKGATSIANRYENILGLFTLRMSVFGGVIAGFVAYGVMKFANKVTFKNEWLDVVFGEGKMGVAIVIPVMLLFGPVLFYIWQLMFIILKALSVGVEKTSFFGTFLFGYTERALMPFGVHHTFYMPFWQTALGGTQDVAGQTVQGAQNIFFAQMQDSHLTHFSVEHGSRFWGGRYIFDIFGIPAAAAALFLTLPKEKRKTSGSLLLSAALTSMITGITEPFEFIFIFIAPALFWGPYCILAGLAHLAVHAGNIGVGQVFSGGGVEFILFGILQGDAKTTWTNILWIGPIFSVAYFSLMYFWVKGFEVNILGRLDNATEAQRVKLKKFNFLKLNDFHSRRGVKNG